MIVRCINGMVCRGVARALAVLIIVGVSAVLAASAATAPKDPVSHAAMRLLKAECFSCHNSEKHKGGLGDGGQEIGRAHV